MPEAGAGAAWSGRRPLRGFAAFKWLVYALLAANVLLYGVHGTPTEQVDTGAWVVLLLLFEWETGGWRTSPRLRRWLHALRIPAAGAVLWACCDYALAGEWLDFGNALTWLGVVAMLELEVRIPPRRLLLHALRRWIAIALYLTLAGFLFAWLVLGATEGGAAVWLDAWDALLWLVAFVVIELNVFGFRQCPAAP
ncbi:hypothetical protein [Luteimonas aquatica]|uniref:hypothetical protein n=1 Tax=Luteimonas aquatica TaxID=450364 RepID=UPI001F5A899B|nr:hypothetical protein [Luteimonas aquatica]